ncbi:CfaE/CblD family pilus tip adhesin [Escherichia coli]|uniref:CfaE/CblD family pilus tip adhesin n=1 Tax=Escherichia coli TaxID=562 RepID=UPI000989B0F7|nr:CfaE/CblD family pilus tip adhesin [Escherichia coli]
MNNHFFKRIFFPLAIIMGVLLPLSPANADEWSKNIPVDVSIDLIHPGSVPVWKDKDMDFSGKLPTGGNAEANLGFVCNSKSDTTFGACTTRLTSWGVLGQGSNVLLRFTNIKTRAIQDLTVTGHWRTGCGNGGNGFTGVVGACSWGGIAFFANLPETELRKLPYGGVWNAQMRLKTMSWRGNVKIGEVVTYIRLNVRSEASISIPNSTVKLPVTITGHSDPVFVDTCLFDGTGSGEYSRYELRLDDLSGGGKGNMFALKNVTKPDAHPLYYTVSAGPPGTRGNKTVWTPGVSKVFSGMDKVPTTGTVTIRGKTVPCVQWPLALKLQPFNPVRQAMGQYQGQINLVFTPSLNMP